MGVGSLLQPCGVRNLTQVIRLVSWCLRLCCLAIFSMTKPYILGGKIIIKTQDTLRSPAGKLRKLRKETTQNLQEVPETDRMR